MKAKSERGFEVELSDYPVVDDVVIVSREDARRLYQQLEDAFAGFDGVSVVGRVDDDFEVDMLDHRIRLRILQDGFASDLFRSRAGDVVRDVRYTVSVSAMMVGGPAASAMVMVDAIRDGLEIASKVVSEWNASLGGRGMAVVTSFDDEVASAERVFINGFLKSRLQGITRKDLSGIPYQIDVQGVALPCDVTYYVSVSVPWRKRSVLLDVFVDKHGSATVTSWK